MRSKGGLLLFTVIQSPTGGRHVRVNVALPSFCRAQINKGTWDDCGQQASRVPFI